MRIGKLKVKIDSPLVKGEYPRLLMTRAQIPAIRARMNHPEMRRYLTQAQDLVKTGKARPLLLAALYQVTGDRQYAELAKKKLGGPSWNPSWTFTFDILAETMTDGERKDYARKLLEQVKANRWRPRLLHCLVAWGNGVDDELAPFLQSSHANEVVRTLRRNNNWTRGRGGSSMGHGYHGEHFFSAEYAALIGWSHATGEDLLTQADFDDQQPAWYVYHYLPWKKSRQVIRVGVTMSPFHLEALTPRKFSAENYIMLAITQTRNGLGQWWQREFIGKWPRPRRGKAPDQHPYGLAGRLLWLDPAIPSVPPEKFPETRLFPVNGHVVMRSDWTEDATVALFRCGRFGTIDGHGGRNNLDNLHFIIYRNGYLAPDTGCVHAVNEGVWKMPRDSNVHLYGKQTIAHNSITIGRQRLEIRGNRNFLVASSVRGGQMRGQVRAWLKLLGLDYMTYRYKLKLAEITAYSTSPEYDYACGDATHSYPPTRVKKITRQFVYIKPDLFVIFDRVTPADPKLEVIWNLHAYQRPAWNGKTAPDARKEGHFLHTGGDTFTTTNRAGTFMDTRLLLPAQAERTVRTIGGKGHDFEVNGVNHGPTEETYKLFERRKGNGGLEGVAGWRIEVSPKTVTGEVHFLHVLRVGDPVNGKKTPLKTTLVKQADRTGAKITLGGKSCEVTFNTAGETGGRIVLGGRAEDLVTKIDDNYDRWKADPRYNEWMTNEYMRTVIFPYGKKP